LFLPLMPHAVEQLDFCDYDLIVSFNYAVVHGVRNRNGARHVAYTYTPLRYAWSDLNLDGTHTQKNPAVRQILNVFRKWDVRAAARVHEIAAISEVVANRINCSWNRQARVIYPPVELERFHPSAQRDSYYITVSRLVPHKRIDLLVRAFSQLKLPLIVIGSGPELRRLKTLAAPTIQFLGYESDERTAELLGKARGFVCAAEEDFGIAIVEAQAAGCPVIAYGRGGALESVRGGVTGLLFAEQSVECIIEAMRAFDKRYPNFDPAQAVRNVQRFSKARFIGEFSQFVESNLDIK
jgi:glycosyltransferase involved in cell wall biosynthesis